MKRKIIFPLYLLFQLNNCLWHYVMVFSDNYSFVRIMNILEKKIWKITLRKQLNKNRNMNYINPI